MSPQVGQSGQIKYTNGDTKPGVIHTVDSATQVDVTRIGTSNSNVPNLPYVEIGGTPPSPPVDYFQEIALA